MEITRIGPSDWETFQEVRLASLADAPEAFGSSHADWVDAPAERWQARLTQVPLTLVARDAATAVGVVCGTPVDEQWVELISMWVSPTARGTGAARRLIDAVVDWGAAQDRDTFLLVRDDNIRAIRAYERAGFVDTGIPADQPAGDPPERRMERRRP